MCQLPILNLYLISVSKYHLRQWGKRTILYLHVLCQQKQPLYMLKSNFRAIWLVPCHLNRYPRYVYQFAQLNMLHLQDLSLFHREWILSEMNIYHNNRIDCPNISQHKHLWVLYPTNLSRIWSYLITTQHVYIQLQNSILIRFHLPKSLL